MADSPLGPSNVFISYSHRDKDYLDRLQEHLKPHVRAGTVKALAIATKKRSPLLPDVPTSYEQGLPEFDCAPFYAVFAPKGTPKAIIDKLAEALSKGLSEEGVQKRLAELGADIAEPNRRGPKALGDLVRSEVARLMPILKDASSK